MSSTAMQNAWTRSPFYTNESINTYMMLENENCQKLLLKYPRRRKTNYIIGLWCHKTVGLHDYAFILSVATKMVDWLIDWLIDWFIDLYYAHITKRICTCMRIRTLTIYQFKVIYKKLKKTHMSNKIVEGPVDEGTPRHVIMIIWEFIWVVSLPHRVCSVSGVRE